jgi:hypothetical protein
MTAVAFPEPKRATTSLRKAWISSREQGDFGSYATWTSAARDGKLDRFGVVKIGKDRWQCPDPVPQGMLDLLARSHRPSTGGKVHRLETPGMGALHTGFWREYQDSLEQIQDLKRRLSKAEQRADRAEQLREAAQARLDRLRDGAAG